MMNLCFQESVLIQTSIVEFCEGSSLIVGKKEANSETFYDIGDKKAVEVSALSRENKGSRVPCVAPPPCDSRERTSLTVNRVVRILVSLLLIASVQYYRKPRKPFVRDNPN